MILWNRAFLCALGLFTPLATLACSTAKSDSPSPNPRSASLDSVYVDGLAFRDGRGRQLLFRGYNAKIQGIFDSVFDDGRVPAESFRSFEDADAVRFEELGFN